MKKTLMGILLVLMMLIACSSDSEPRYADVCNSGTCDDSVCCDCLPPLAKVELAIASFMASPDVPITDLENDPRVSSFTQCGSAASFGDCTQNVDKFLKVSPGTQTQSFVDFVDGDRFKYWYCLYPDGRVEGFTDETHHRMREGSFASASSSWKAKKNSYLEENPLPDRTISRTLPKTVVAGEQFEVLVKISGCLGFGRITEVLPDGFSFVDGIDYTDSPNVIVASITGYSSDGFTFDNITNPADSQIEIDGQRVECSFLGFNADFSYTVLAPDSQGEYKFDGTFIDDGKMSFPIGSDTTINVVANSPKDE